MKVAKAPNKKRNGSVPMPHPGIYAASFVSAIYTPATLEFIIK